jgi:hypothetical protein
MCGWTAIFDLRLLSYRVKSAREPPVVRRRRGGMKLLMARPETTFMDFACMKIQIVSKLLFTNIA